VNLKKELTKCQLRQVACERKSGLAGEEASNGFERIDTDQQALTLAHDLCGRLSVGGAGS
jgi:hypothetical protein